MLSYRGGTASEQQVVRASGDLRVCCLLGDGLPQFDDVFDDLIDRWGIGISISISRRRAQSCAAGGVDRPGHVKLVHEQVTDLARQRVCVFHRMPGPRSCERQERASAIRRQRVQDVDRSSGMIGIELIRYRPLRWRVGSFRRPDGFVAGRSDGVMATRRGFTVYIVGFGYVHLWQSRR